MQSIRLKVYSILHILGGKIDIYNPLSPRYVSYFLIQVEKYISIIGSVNIYWTLYFELINRY